MIVIPLTILALAAGIYLLVHIKQAGLGGLYKYLAWLVVLLSLLFIVCSVVRGVRHHRHMREYHASGQCRMGGHEGGACCPYMKSGCCSTAGSCSMSGGHGECTMGAQACSKDGEAAKAASCTKGADGAKTSCCSKGGTKAAADSAAKK